MLYLQKLPLRWPQTGGPLLITILSVALYWLEPFSGVYLAYDVKALPCAEPWRWFSGNFVHTNGTHLLLNLAGVWMLWLLHGHYYTWRNFTVQIVCYSVFVTVAIYTFSPYLHWYAGLSGVLHGVFVWGAARDIISQQFGGKLLMAGVWGKIAYEQQFGGSVDIAEMINATVAVDAHLYGAIGGVLLLILSHLWRLVKR